MRRPPSPTDVVTCFVAKDRKILVLRRSSKVGTYRGRWSGVSGYLEARDPLDQAWTELREEIGAARESLVLERAAEPVVIEDEETGTAWRVHPFLFSAAAEFEPCLDWENLEARWVLPDTLGAMSTVPGLAAVWRRLAG